jgi:zinc/manganese transport system ATP-binding protein
LAGERARGPAAGPRAGDAAIGAVAELRGATATRGGRTVWSDVDLEVSAGEFVAILGPNGAGKSTFLEVLLGLLPLRAGRASVLGAPAGERRERIGYLPQRRAFDAGVRVRGRDLVALGFDGTRWGIPLPGRGGATRARVDAMLEEVGATGYANRPIGECSGGEQQRLLIAQALVRSPEMLLLDEPLESLDLANQASVSALAAHFCRERGIAVVLVAHDPNPLLPYVDRVIYFGRGRAMAGSPAEVITTESLSALYGAGVEVLHRRDGRLVVVGQPDTPAHHHEH